MSMLKKISLHNCPFTALDRKKMQLVTKKQQAVKFSVLKSENLKEEQVVQK